MKRAAVFGWGLVAPGAANIDEFQEKLASGQNLLERFDGFGPDTFLVGRPKFDFAEYEAWLSERFPSSRYKQLIDKLDQTSLMGVGAFIQALGQNAGLEKALQEVGPEAHVYVGNALSGLPTIARTTLELHRAQRRWNRFWAASERNEARRAFEAGTAPSEPPPTDPSTINDPDEREEAEDAWFAFWAARSSSLAEYLEEFRDIESQAIEGDVATGKMKLLRDKRRRTAALKAKWETPDPPWDCVSANVLWNTPNAAASQITMLGKIHGPSYAPVAACSTFGVSLKLGLEAIQRGDAKLVVVGAADPPPHPVTVAGFYRARVVSADGTPSKPLSRLKGTHVAGGSCIWILGDLDWGKEQGLVPQGIEPLAVELTSDADHIITPSVDGPKMAMRAALEAADVDAADLKSWDMHATATPGDFLELENLQSIAPRSTEVTARKGTFGHGMGCGGGWELTAQYLGVAEGRLYPTPLPHDELHETISGLGQSLVLDQGVDVEKGPVGKLSMGVGGINACTISHPFTDDDET